MRRLVLASTSPYRRTLLERLGLPFETADPQCDETRLPAETAPQLVTRLSELKARAVGLRYPDALIIGSDQVAVVDNRIVGKPGSHARAAEQLRACSGQQVDFLTGICLLDSASDAAQVDLINFNVRFRVLDDRQIRNYLRAEQPYNCACSFKAEGLGISLVEAMQGDDPNALIGLPLIRLVDFLIQAGLSPLEHLPAR